MTVVIKNLQLREKTEYIYDGPYPLVSRRLHVDPRAIARKLRADVEICAQYPSSCGLIFGAEQGTARISMSRSQKH